MIDDEELRAKLAKVEALFRGAAGPGERAAAAAANETSTGEVWLEFSMLHTELEIYFQDVTDHLITRAMGSDGDDGGPRPRVNARPGEGPAISAVCRMAAISAAMPDASRR